MTEVAFKSQLKAAADRVNAALDSLLANQPAPEPRLAQAMRYTIQSPGKRLRGALVLFACQAIAGQTNPNAENAAAAVELVHTYSLIHDDLPAMDNDDLRRGQPTCHKAFDEPTAILTGDALLTLAFETLAQNIDDPALSVALIKTLAEAAGPNGMISGQMADLRAENAAADKNLLDYIHLNKTAKMFACATQMGALCAGAGPDQLDALKHYGLKLGLAFQIADDILDVCSTAEQIGKTAGKDAQAGKMTYPSVVGLTDSRLTEKALAAEAISSLEQLGSAAEPMRQLANALIERTK